MATHLFDSRKGVQFVKGTTGFESSLEPTKSRELDGDEISSFYENLIAESSSTNAGEPKPKVQEPQVNSRIRRSKPKATRSVESRSTVQLTERDERLFFKAAATNQTDKLTEYLERGFLPNLVDQFGWTPLMCAAAEGAVATARILLMHGASLTHEASGVTAEQLALANNKRDVLNLFRAYRETETSRNKLTLPIPELGSSFCPICRVEFTDSNHETSIAHVVNQKHKSDVGYSYGIRMSNAGYRLLKQSGWMEGEGLGQEAQGRKYPIRTTLKRDRKGLGLEQNVQKVTHFEGGDLNVVKNTKRPRGSYIRKLKSNIEKNQNNVMRIRRILSSD